MSQAYTDSDLRYRGSGSAPACKAQSSATANYNAANGNPTYCEWTDTLFSYDAMGRAIHIGAAPPSEAGWAAHDIGMQYDLAGNLIQMRYPDGRVVTQTWDAAGHQQTSTFDNWGGQHVGYTYASNFTYTPWGAMTEMTYGNSMYTHVPYNNRQQACQFWVSSLATTQGISDKHYAYGGGGNYCGTQALNNGNIAQILDMKNSNRSQGFSYDALNRVYAFSSGDATMQQSYTYDSFGNISQSGTFTSQLSYSPKNQISTAGYGYDAAGNLTSYNNGVFTNTYSFDADSRMYNLNAGAGWYTYDAEGERMRKDAGGTYTEYQYLNGQPIAEKHSDGTWSDYIFANGKMIARADSFNRYIRFTGTFSATGNYGEETLTPASPSLIGYSLRSGDQLVWKQNQTTAYGGVYLFTSASGTTAWTLKDQNGEYTNSSQQTDGNWHSRTVDLSSFAGKSITQVVLVADLYSPPGNWATQFADIVVVSTDGLVQPIYNGSTGVSASSWGHPDLRMLRLGCRQSPLLRATPITTMETRSARHV